MVDYIQKINISTGTATVNVQVKYTKKSGENLTQSLKLFLVWNSVNKNWSIDTVTLN